MYGVSGTSNATRTVSVQRSNSPTDIASIEIASRSQSSVTTSHAVIFARNAINLVRLAESYTVGTTEQMTSALMNITTKTGFPLKPIPLFCRWKKL